MVDGAVAGSGDRPRVLLLEDEPADAELIERELVRAGLSCETHVVADRESYRAALRDWRPDIVLSDYSLRGFSAPEALRILHAELPTTPLIVVTGAVDEETAVECVKAGAADYLFKGRLGRLAVAVRRALDERRILEAGAEARAQLETSRRLLQTIIDSTSDPVFAKDLSGRYLICNAGLARMVGKSASELVGRDDAFLFGGREAEVLREADRRAIDAGEATTFEERLTSASGQTRTFLSTRGPLRDAEGRVTGLFGISRDITERKRAEDELRTHYAILQGIVEGSDALVFSVDRDVRYTSFNNAHRNVMKVLYGTDIELGDSPLDHMTSEDRDAARVNFRRAIAGERFTVNTIAGDPARAPRLYEIFHGPIRADDGAVIGAVVFARDITERKRTEDQLRKLSRAVDQSPVSIVITDTSGDIEYVNPKCSEATGYPEQELIGRNSRVLKSGHTSPEVYGELWRTIANGNEWRGEFRNRRKDGSLFWEEASISPIRDADGRITHYLAVKEDITQRKRAEEELRQTQQQLLQAQKMESIGRLAGGIAHDFNNLLTAINGFSEIALESLPPDDPVRHDIEQVREAGDRAEKLTRRLLAFSRQQVLEPRVVSLNTVISGLVGMLRRVIGEQVAFEARLAEDLGRVLADPGQIEQVIVNLAVNARDAMPGGGRLTIETANVDLESAYVARHPETRSGPHVMLAVTDTGTGMTEEVRRHAFEPFFTTKPPGAGSGLGLSMVYGIVRQSGGNVWVYSEPGRGTSVKVYLPRIEPAPRGAEEPETDATSAPEYQGSESILILEDDDAVRSLARQWLAQFGYTVLEAGTVEDALEVASRADLKIDLVLTDVVMPSLDGTAVVARLRTARPSLKVVYMSGYPDTALGAMRELGPGDGFLQKPFTAAALGRKVRQALDHD